MAPSSLSMKLFVGVVNGWTQKSNLAFLPLLWREAANARRCIKRSMDTQKGERARGCNPEGEGIYLPSSWEQRFIDQEASRWSPAWGPLLYRDPVNTLQTTAILTPNKHMSQSQSHRPQVWHRGRHLTETLPHLHSEMALAVPGTVLLTLVSPRPQP